jgi:hypothetical protein
MKVVRNVFRIASSIVAKHIRPAIRVSRHSVHLKQARDLQQWYAACIVELYRPRPETWILIPLDLNTTQRLRSFRDSKSTLSVRFFAPLLFVSGLSAAPRLNLIQTSLTVSVPVGTKRSPYTLDTFNIGSGT